MKHIFLSIILIGTLSADEKSKLISDIEQSLMATCCWSGTVYDHGNKEMEIEIAGMVQAGKTKTEILDYYTDKYGERVLSVPVAE
nr:cytochrome c-type biogenesis protein CcmH [Candidatus Neomarinimicrobiota bacterium]